MITAKQRQPLCLGSARAIHCIVTNLMYSWNKYMMMMIMMMSMIMMSMIMMMLVMMMIVMIIIMMMIMRMVVRMRMMMMRMVMMIMMMMMMTAMMVMMIMMVVRMVDEEPQNMQDVLTHEITLFISNKWWKLIMRHIVMILSIDKTVNLLRNDIYWPISKDFIARKKSWKENVTFGPMGYNVREKKHSINDDGDVEEEEEDHDNDDDSYWTWWCW